MSAVFAVVAVGVAVWGVSPLLAFAAAGPAMFCGYSAFDNLPKEAVGHRATALAALLTGVAVVIGVSMLAIQVH